MDKELKKELKKCIVTGYVKNYDKLSLNLYKNNPLEYELAINLMKLKSLILGYVSYKTMIPTKKGTKIRYKKINDKDMYREEYGKLIEIIARKLIEIRQNKC